MSSFLGNSAPALVGALATAAAGLAAAVASELWKRVGDDAPNASLANGSATTTSPSRVPLTILYATTTGTSKRYAQQLQKDVFALNINGFHFDLKSADLADYNAEELEEERLVVFLLPTWTGGVPCASAQPFLAYLRDLLLDFRVSKTHLGKLQYAVFGLGNSEYDQNWCKAAIDLDEALRSLSAEPLLPVAKGDDSADQDGTFASWCTSLIPALCEQYRVRCGGGVGVRDDDEEEAGGCGTCGTCGTGAASGGRDDEDSPCGQAGCSCQAGASAGTGAGQAQPDGKVWLSQKEYRRQKRRAAEEAERRKAREAAKAAAAAARAAAGLPDSSSQGGSSRGELVAGDTSSETDGMLEYTEEDAINDRLLAESDARLAAETAAAGGGHAGQDRHGGSAVSAPAGVSRPPTIAEFVDSDDEDGGTGDKQPFSAKAGAVSSAGGSSAGRARSGSPGGVYGAGEEGGLVDLEDIGTVIAKASEERKKEEEDFASGSSAREMVTPAQRKALTKEGYKIIGSHSAVKLCRWTKAQLRGRGGCYKHTLYGIQSYQCMEATPSLACANKCTFCWRHHKNPVGRSWRWKIDDPEMIVKEAIEKHVAMIKEFKGAPGVLMERWAEAHAVRHCALSLVGEPIMYPHVNEMLRHLHNRRISTFLVTNAQFPEAIANLEPVTQLYVSVDAATKDVLRAVDRPLFSDFWERFLASLAALKTKGQRTVYRLTLVKGQNCGSPENVREYAELIKVGQPDFIEVKGVTWCGVSEGSDLTMANVPWHEEVREFTQQLAEAAGAGYELASEHAHSCCVLLAKTRFKVDGRWHTHIDYERFHDLMARYYASGGKETFTSLDYMAPTPEWAVFGANEAGFDPIETRWRRTRGGDGVAEINYKSSESGCG